MFATINNYITYVLNGINNKEISFIDINNNNNDSSSSGTDSSNYESDKDIQPIIINNYDKDEPEAKLKITKIKRKTKVDNKELEKISSALSEYSQAFGTLEDIVGGGSFLVLRYTRLLTSIDDFTAYDVNCVNQTHSNILMTVRRVLSESGISKESELKSQEIYSLLSETEDNPKFKVEFDPDSSYKFIYNSDNKPETYNSRHRNWFMGSHPITPYVENPPQQKLFNQTSFGVNLFQSEGFICSLPTVPAELKTLTDKRVW